MDTDLDSALRKEKKEIYRVLCKIVNMCIPHRLYTYFFRKSQKNISSLITVDSFFIPALDQGPDPEVDPFP